ncbi:50S ribosomal protein L23 [endosymbiont of Acanthamoeba sp. UWC8]|uniref:50S ribosomal protein L23 n=1 Tax=endosymbiont of Acanthamoeba sp. UWC8 TaxID=86106 RepID=UPI0004D1507E|nr:50S ribosomal protein L23 [endosymbiont of Acanthamoeba sp. UWC8]AIF81731.1 50S ribosomal protein L23 [endosymbiont of Acanthamoeba sp. UWC8]
MIQEYLYDVLICPLYTEKSTIHAEQSKSSFKISGNATKAQVKNAVEKIFNAKVLKVNVINCKGKKKIFKGVKGKRSDYKKAIVTLEKGKTIDFAGGAK